MALVKFSTFTAQLLKEQIPKIEELSWTNENENTSELDLETIKQLKGCRTGLVQNCLKLIEELDALVNSNFSNSDEKKNYCINARQSLIEDLEKYMLSCERYPRTKDFLNLIPNNISGMVGFIAIVSTFIATSFPPVAIIPLSILTLGSIDLIFNNRETAKNFQQSLFSVEDQLRSFKKNDEILKINVSKPSETQETSLSSIPSTSRDYSAIPSTSGNYNSFSTTSSCRFFNPTIHADEANSSDSDSFLEPKTISDNESSPPYQKLL